MSAALPRRASDIARQFETGASRGWLGREELATECQRASEQSLKYSIGQQDQSDAEQASPKTALGDPNPPNDDKLSSAPPEEHGFTNGGDRTADIDDDHTINRSATRLTFSSVDSGIGIIGIISTSSTSNTEADNYEADATEVCPRHPEDFADEAHVGPDIRATWGLPHHLGTPNSASMDGCSVSARAPVGKNFDIFSIQILRSHR